MNIRKVLKYWSLPVAWMLLIFSLSAISTHAVSKVYWREFVIKKTAHLTEYAILSTLLYRALRQSMSKSSAAILAVVISVLYAMTDEFHQSFTPGREPAVRDIVFDTIGASLAILFIWNFIPTAPKKLKELAKKLEII